MVADAADEEAEESRRPVENEAVEAAEFFRSGENFTLVKSTARGGAGLTGVRALAVCRGTQTVGRMGERDKSGPPELLSFRRSGAGGRYAGSGERKAFAT